LVAVEQVVMAQVVVLVLEDLEVMEVQILVVAAAEEFQQEVVEQAVVDYV
jgi:hypothetical protein